MFKNLFNKPRIKVQTVKKDDYSGWIKCSGCGELIHDNELEKNKSCCPKCDYHYRLTGLQRIELLSDAGSFHEMFTQFQATDPLNFVDSESYKERLQKAKKKTGRDEGAIVGTCTIGGISVALGILDFSFMGGSMGSVVGEKLTSIIEHGLQNKLPVVIVSASGGARMQESILSLMQMAKTSAALGKLNEAGVPYISILTNPTTGGVTASFASLGDIIMAEPDALIGFAGSRVVEQTIGQKLPPGAQKSEFLLEKGMIDCIVSRHELKNKLHSFLRFLTGNARDFKEFSDIDEKSFGKMPQKLKELLVFAEQELTNVK
jgi:acetyl-CoA carboxylase carboxyl transferase subunit beta